ncbi:MAG: cobalamin biosynthesis protein CobW [Alphaproteobacteria bacterium]
MKKIPATIFTGFLGAGKTSMIRHLLTNAEGRRIALIINEFGDMGVDGELLKSCDSPACKADEIVELANGCICCTVADDFLPTIEAILARPERPDHIIIETSGLALPKPLIKAFAWPEVKAQVTVDGVVAVVDAAAVADDLFATDVAAVQAQREADEALDHESPLEELFEEQLAAADMVIINKADLVNEAEMAKARANVDRETREGTKVITATMGEVAASVLLGINAAAEDDLDSRKSHHDGVGEHEHDDFNSQVVHIPNPATSDSLVKQLVELVGNHEIYRIKGFVAIDGKPMRMVVQGVGTRFQTYFDREWQSGEKQDSKLVIIGDHDLDFDTIRATLTA